MVNYGCLDHMFVAVSFETTSSRQFGVFEARAEAPIPD